jgi:hypothetical protein
LSGPTPLIFDIARIDRQSSRRYTEESLRGLVARLQLTDEALFAGIERANELRELFKGMRQARRAPGSVYEKIVRASLFADVGPIVAALGQESVANVRGRVLLGGSSPPDERVHQAIESCGWLVAADFYDRNLERLGGAVEIFADNPVQAISQSWLRQTFLGRDLKESERRLQELVRQADADAAILWFGRDDEALAWQVPRLRRALEDSGIPFVVLSARDWDFSDGAGREIQIFLDGLRT